MDFDLYDHAEQLDWMSACERDRLIEREDQVRELAQRAAEFDPPSYGVPYQAAMQPNPGYAYPTGSKSAIGAVSYRNISVNIHPAIQGTARVLLAEKMIRDQLGADIP
jgi:hypothetical protein